MEKKTLIAIVTCRTRAHSWAQAIRDTWLPLVPPEKADVRFFVGRGDLVVPEYVVQLDCLDDYQSLPDKVRSIARWAKEHGYDFMLKCDDDCVIKPVELLSSGYENYEYSGKANRPPQPYVVPMGFNYWLGKKSIGIVSEAPLPEDFDDEKWVAKTLWDHGIVLTNDDRYYLHVDPFPVAVIDTYTRRAARPLRAVPRPTVTPFERKYFSRCIHIAGEQHTKLEEFRKVFIRYFQS